MHRHFLRAGTAFTLLLVMIGCWSNQAAINAQEAQIDLDGSRNKVRETVQQQFAAQKVIALRVRDDSGDIRVTAGDDTNEIAIYAETIVSGDRSVTELKSCLARVEANTHLEGDTLVVRADYPHEEFSEKHINVAINYVVALPKRLALDLLSHSGNVEAKGAKGGVKAHSASGNVFLADVAGTLEATSASGDVTVNGATIRGSLRLDSSSGNVRAEGIRVSGSALSVTMKSNSGKVDFEGDAGELNLYSVSGNITGKVTSTLPLSRADLHSVSGNVALAGPKMISATIHARTNSGNIRMRGTLGVKRNINEDGIGRSLKLTLGGGSAPVTLETGSGDVEFSAR